MDAFDTRVGIGDIVNYYIENLVTKVTGNTEAKTQDGSKQGRF